MKVLIIGSGLIGVTLASCLRHRGHDVVVLDRELEAGRATSFANGGLLTPSMAEPWSTPGCWWTLIGSLGKTDAALKLRLKALPSLWKWGVTFLRNSNSEKFERNTLCNLRLALYSLAAMRTLQVRTGVQYDRAARGSLRIFRDTAGFDGACRSAARRVSEGLGFRALSVAETIAFEPALEPIAGQLRGAIHYDSDEVGDAHGFCAALAAHAQKDGVDFRFGTEALRLEARAGRLTGVVSSAGTLVADAYVVAAGSYSTRLLQDVRIELAVRPVKGYSISIVPRDARPMLRVPIVDDHLHAVVTPIGNMLRAAGTAEFAGFDSSLPAARVRNLIRLIRAVLPEIAFDPAAASPWCGLRPVSADGVPIIGKTKLENLFVSSGHGHLGWTMATGSAELLAALITGDRPQIDASLFELSRFAFAQ